MQRQGTKRNIAARAGATGARAATLPQLLLVLAASASLGCGRTDGKAVGPVQADAAQTVAASNTEASPQAATASARAPEPVTVRPVASLVQAVGQLTQTIGSYGGKLGVAILDAASGDLLASHEERRPMNPASNAKLFTAAAALSQLHGNYHFETGLYGEQKGSSVAHLVLRGRGDPSLSTKDLWDMVGDLRDLGVRRVEGDVLVDQRFFDESFVPPAFEQQPNEWAYFRAPVSAVALNENTIRMTVRPTAPGSPATVAFDPPGFVDVDGTVKTAAEDRPQNVRLELAPNGQRLVAKIGGTIPDKARPVSFTRRVDNPMLLGGYALKSLLTSSGISVGGDVKLGGETVKSLLVIHRSRPLSELLSQLGKQSNNFYAEMVLKTLGGERKRRPGRSGDGAEVIARYLTEVGAWEEGTVIKNGSGLFDANRVSALETAKLLRSVQRDSAIAPEFIAHLAIGGVDGTLHGRFREFKERRAVRAKTGTLESAAALSGYVLGPPGKAPLVFSILVNEIPGKVSGARAAIDKCVEAMVRFVWKKSDEARAKP